MIRPLLTPLLTLSLICTSSMRADPPPSEETPPPPPVEQTAPAPMEESSYPPPVDESEPAPVEEVAPAACDVGCAATDGARTGCLNICNLSIAILTVAVATVAIILVSKNQGKHPHKHHGKHS